MPPQFDLNAMAIFVKVVQAGSFIGAARALDVPKKSRRSHHGRAYKVGKGWWFAQFSVSYLEPSVLIT